MALYAAYGSNMDPEQMRDLPCATMGESNARASGLESEPPWTWT